MPFAERSGFRNTIRRSGRWWLERTGPSGCFEKCVRTASMCGRSTIQTERSRARWRLDRVAVLPVPWSPRLGIALASRDEVWGTTLDEYEVPYIHRYRVDRTCAP